jgi:hypothetical protein
MWKSFVHWWWWILLYTDDDVLSNDLREEPLYLKAPSCTYINIENGIICVETIGIQTQDECRFCPVNQWLDLIISRLFAYLKRTVAEYIIDAP